MPFLNRSFPFLLLLFHLLPLITSLCLSMYMNSSTIHILNCSFTFFLLIYWQPSSTTVCLHLYFQTSATHFLSYYILWSPYSFKHSLSLHFLSSLFKHDPQTHGVFFFSLFSDLNITFSHSFSALFLSSRFKYDPRQLVFCSLSFFQFK